MASKTPHSVIRSFNRPARLFLVATLINGIVFSIWWLFFNFYILELGFSLEYLGLVTSVTSAAALLLGIPLGVLSDRIGRKKAMIWGVSIYIVAMGLEVLVLNPNMILVMAFISGAGHTLYFISQPPFMMKVSNAQNRTLLFSLNFGLVTLSGAVGSLFAGQLPALFGDLLGVAADSASAYRAVLFSAVILSSLALLPLSLIREPHTANGDVVNNRAEKTNSVPVILNSLKTTFTRPITVKLSLPMLMLGFGAAILIPYMNIFFRDTFAISDQTLGILFSLSALMTGVGSLIAPRLTTELGSKIRAIVLTQSLSVVSLLILGFSPFFGLAAVAFLLRSALMNMSVPLYDAFSMEHVREQEQATVVSVKELAWQAGWTIGPFISGVVQESYGFTPLFITTAVLYAISIIMTWGFFHNTERKPI
ncbi:MAG: MFS transporter [Anaerolineales bacterium]